MTAGLVLIYRGDGEKVRHAVRADMVIGSGRKCDVRLREQGVLRRHAVIEHFASGFSIRGVKPGAHLLVNSRQVDRATLSPGDLISVGTVELAVEAGETTSVWEQPPQQTPRAVETRSLHEDPVPAPVLARIRTPEGPTPHFPGPPKSRRRSVATHRGATYFCLAIVLADAVALGWYLEGL
jgi:pSer/pThr/pTyr-binding forkhead associated (FHA) protein